MLSRPDVLLPVFDLEKGKSSLVFPFKIVDFGYFTSFLRQAELTVWPRAVLSSG